MSTKMLESASLKAVGIDQHTIEFYMLAFSKMPDKQGDRIAPTAADEWLANFYKAGRPLPISFTHAAVKDSSDPFAIVGYAPADPEHVRKDDHGILVRAYLDTETNETAQQVYALTKRGVVNGASVAYVVPDGGERHQRDGSTLITKMEILEAGPCLDPANKDAYVVAVKALETKAVDNSPWDGNAAMSACSSASDYRSICAGEHTYGDPDERQHWALPHHSRPGAPPNAAGVRNSLSRLPQTQQLANREAAQRHLDAHMTQINPQTASAERVSFDARLRAIAIEMKAGRKISKTNADVLRQARDLIDRLLALADTSQGRDNADELSANADDPNAWLREGLMAAEAAT